MNTPAVSSFAPHRAVSAPATSTSHAVRDVELTLQQARHFDLFGFLRLPGLISDRIREVQEDFDRVWARSGGGHDGKPHDGQRRSCIYPFIDQDARLSSLLDDPRIHGLLVSLLGSEFNYIGSDGNYYAGDTPWHSDGAHTGPRYLKVAIYLDALDARSGALRVVPGSHRMGEPYADLTRAMVPKAAAELGIDGNAVPAIAFTTTPGDVVVFNHNLLHGAFHGGSHRRMFTINCCAHHGPEALPELQRYLTSHARFLIERNIGPEMLRTAGPERMRHLVQVQQNDFGIAQTLADERAKRSEPSRG
jgi:hypothetical protein